MDQATSTNDFLNTTIVEGLANNVCPIHKALTEVTIFHTKVQSDAFQNLLLSHRGRIGLLKGHRKTLKECFVENVSANEATIIRTLTLGVGSSNHIETSSGFHKAANLLQENTFAFKNTLQT